MICVDHSTCHMCTVNIVILNWIILTYALFALTVISSSHWSTNEKLSPTFQLDQREYHSGQCGFL